MRTTPFAVYILTTRRNTVLYTGITNDLARRLAEHRAGLGGRFTRRYSVVRLVYVEYYEDARTAIAREKQIKAWRREKKLALVHATNPTWRDLDPSRYG